MANNPRVQTPGESVFLVVERVLDDLTKPGARLAVSLMTNACFYMAAFLGVPHALWPANTCLWVALLHLRPTPPQGRFTKLMSLFKRTPVNRRHSDSPGQLG